MYDFHDGNSCQRPDDDGYQADWPEDENRVEKDDIQFDFSTEEDMEDIGDSLSDLEFIFGRSLDADPTSLVEEMNRQLADANEKVHGLKMDRAPTKSTSCWAASTVLTAECSD